MRSNESKLKLPAIHIALLLFSLALYVFSAGPVFAYHQRYPEASTRFVLQYYRPLFRMATGTMVRYMDWWGVSNPCMYPL
jgi:hypothetical protein